MSDSERIKKHYMQTPCNNCPFRSDKGDDNKFYLREERARGIFNDSCFVCHKTTGGDFFDRKQCAGHMIAKGMKNDFVSLASELGITLDLKIVPVFKSEEDFVNHQKSRFR